MKTLVKSRTKFTMVSVNSLTNNHKVQLNSPKVALDFKFYQKLFLVILGLAIFLIFPESPKNSENLCKKYYSADICNIW